MHSSHKTSRQLRAVVVDDHALTRHGMVAALSSHGVSLAGTAGNYHDGLAVARTIGADANTLLLVDMRLSTDGESGLHLLKELPDGVARRGIIITAHPSATEAAACLTHTIGGYLSKACDPKRLVEHLQAVANGGVAVDDSISADVWTSMATVAAYTLTPREHDIAALLRDGVTTNKALAARLYVTESTISTHLERMFTKFEVTDRTGLVAALWRYGLLDSYVA